MLSSASKMLKVICTLVASRACLSIYGDCLRTSSHSPKGAKTFAITKLPTGMRKPSKGTRWAMPASMRSVWLEVRFTGSPDMGDYSPCRREPTGPRSLHGTVGLHHVMSVCAPGSFRRLQVAEKRRVGGEN